MTATPSERWWPSPFGADDQLGMLNHIDEGKRRDALRLVDVAQHSELDGHSDDQGVRKLG